MKATMRKNEKICDEIFSMELETDIDKIVPGQFINVYLKNASKLLPRPLSVCDFESGILRLVYRANGEGTVELSGYRDGDLRILGPLGKGFDIYSTRSILIGGGIGIPPLLYLAKHLKDPIAVLGYKAEKFLVDEFERVCERVYTASESEGEGMITDIMDKHGIHGEDYYACGPTGMLKALSYERLQVSLEERMGCGYGACVGCTCKTKGGLKKVCKDGPVFYGSEVIWS